MKDKLLARSGPVRSFTIRRDKKGALKFNGERIGSATRTSRTPVEHDPTGQLEETHEVSAKLFKTTGGKYVVGIESYNKTAEHYDWRDGFVNQSLDALVEAIKAEKIGDDDLLGELFENTEIADRFVEQID
jgi:hypothetical protein